MTVIRAAGYGLKDQDDDAAFQMLVTDVIRLKQEVRMGSNSGAGGTEVGGPAPTTTTSSSGASGFSAEIAGSYAYPSGTAVIAPFDTERFDTLNAFNLTTGTFTAPAAANYLFIASLVIQNSTAFDDTLQMDLNRNGAYFRAMVLSHWEASSYTTFTGTSSIAASQGDTFNLNLTLPRNGNVAYVVFSGIQF